MQFEEFKSLFSALSEENQGIFMAFLRSMQQDGASVDARPPSCDGKEAVERVEEE